MTVPLDEEEVKKQLEKVSKFADKNQRLSFRRKKERMLILLERIQPIQDKILDLILERTPIMDEIENVRKGMVHECVHPLEYLVHKGTHIQCKFCSKDIKLND